MRTKEEIADELTALTKPRKVGACWIRPKRVLLCYNDYMTIVRREPTYQKWLEHNSTLSLLGVPATDQPQFKFYGVPISTYTYTDQMPPRVHFEASLTEGKF